MEIVQEKDQDIASLKIDRTKLLTIQNYANLKGVHRTTVYKKIQSGVLKCIEIDGVMFIQVA